MEHLLFEHVAGFELFELKQFEKLAETTYNDYMSLTQVVNHISSLPITDSAEVIAELKNLQEGNLSDSLKNFLQINNVKFLHCDKSLKNALQNIGITQKSSPSIARGIKFNLKRILKEAMNKQLVLGVSHSLAKENIKYNLEREDNVVISTGYEVEHLEDEIENLNEKASKLLNWHFPQLKETLKDDTQSLLSILNSEFDHLDSNLIGESFLGEIKDSLSEIAEDNLAMMKEILGIIQEKKALLANLEEYLAQKMKCLAPNLREILGDRLCFKLIHKAGGMMNLALYPASTIQLLGAEKSLFRSLKMKRNTPKYGLIYHLDYLKENQGRMCRSVASKCSIAARIDCFSENRTNVYGKELRALIEKKINSYKSRARVETTGEILARVHKRLSKPRHKKSKSEDVEISNDVPEKEQKKVNSSNLESKPSDKKVSSKKNDVVKSSSTDQKRFKPNSNDQKLDERKFKKRN